jgi:hypothetical protein
MSMPAIATVCTELNTVTAVEPDLEAVWFDSISPHFIQGNQSIIAGATKLIEAKAALKKSKGLFTRLVDQLGMDLGKAERLMQIARHPVLSNSAHAPILPLSWMTLYTLAKLPPNVLEGFIADGAIYPKLERKEAERLVRKARGSNSNGQDRDRDRDHGAERGADHADDGDHGDHGDRGGAHHGAEDGHREADRDPLGCGDQKIEVSATQTAVQDNAIGPDSPGELARKLARLEELERATVRQTRQLIAYESEIEGLQAKLGPETPIRAQRRLFQQAMRALQKSETPGTLDKEVRFLKQSAVTDFIELIRSAVRDGLKPERFDLIYRPELH